MREFRSFLPAETGAILLVALLLASGTAWAQSGVEEYVAPEERTFTPEAPHGPGDEAAAMLLLGGAFLPAIAAWSSMSGRNFTAARRWTVAAFVVAGSQAAYGISRIVFPRPYEGLSPWVPDLGRFSVLLVDPDEGKWFLVAALLGVLAAVGTRLVATAREKKRVRITAGSRVRVPETRTPGPTP